MLRFVLLCAAILNAAVCLGGDLYRDAAERATMSAKYATCEAQSLPVLTPLPDYEYFRCLALSAAEDATNLAETATADADAADSWWKKYSYQQVLRATNQQWNPAKLTEAKQQYDAWVAKSLDHSKRAEEACGLSRNAAMSARLYLAD